MRMASILRHGAHAPCAGLHIKTKYLFYEHGTTTTPSAPATAAVIGVGSGWSPAPVCASGPGLFILGQCVWAKNLLDRNTVFGYFCLNRKNEKSA